MGQMPGLSSCLPAPSSGNDLRGWNRRTEVQGLGKRYTSLGPTTFSLGPTTFHSYPRCNAKHRAVSRLNFPMAEWIFSAFPLPLESQRGVVVKSDALWVTLGQSSSLRTLGPTDLTR